MITEDYCSSEVSKLLREKGFKCGATYSKGFVKDGDGFVGGLVRHEDKITHQLAMKWLREVHKISIDICTVQGKKVSYMFNIWDFACIYDDKKIGGIFDLREQLYDFDTYEEAVEAALKYCLTKII